MNEIDGIPDFIVRLETAAAEMLQLAALELQQQATADLRGGKNPPPYDTPAPRGTFPRVRTGFLGSSILYQPTTVASIRSEKRVRIGYRASAFYGIALGNRGWKWLNDSLDKALPRIQSQLSGFTIRGA